MPRRPLPDSPLATGVPCALVLVLCVAAPHAQQAGRAEGRPAVIHYDWVEDGELRGGVVPVDPTNPLMADVPSADTGDAGDPRAYDSTAVTLLDNGPSSNRIDLVFVGDGYQAAELGEFADAVDLVWPSFLSEPPLDAYASYFNVHRVDVVSVDSGVDNDPTQGISRNTALDMGYWCGGTQRLLCVNVSKARNHANNAPGRDQVLAIANSSMYGGAGYTDLATLAGENSSTIELALHEFGHAFPNLSDEYTYGGPTVYSGPEPSGWNISLQDETALLANQHKWYRWLDLPNVGAFEGGGYSSQGIYRPTQDSKMRSLGRPFEEVNAERFIREIYRNVAPIDAASPPGLYDGRATLFVTPMQPVYHALDVQWSVDGFDVPGATGNTLDLGALRLPPGVHQVTVTVVDNTPMMRNEINRTNVMTETRTWTVVGGVGRGPGLGGVPTVEHPRRF